MSSAFADFKKAAVAKLKDAEQLEIVGLYSPAEQAAAGNPTPNLGQARAEKTAALFVDSLAKERIKLSSKVTADDAARESYKRANFFESVDVRTLASAAPAIVAAASAAPSAAAKASAISESKPITTKSSASSAPPPPSTVGKINSASSAPANADTLKPLPIYFVIRTTKREPDPAIDAYLKTVAAKVVAGARAGITGFTDGRSDTDANRQLAKARSEAIRKELIALGAPANRLETNSQGGANATASAGNDAAAARASNRRVEITLK